MNKTAVRTPNKKRMKLTKTLAVATLVAASLLAGNAALQAQDDSAANPAAKKAAHGMHGRPNLDQIAKELKLTDDQKAKLKTVLEDQQAKVKELRKDTSLSKEDKRAKAKEIRKDTQAKIKEILTPEQYKKWEKHLRQNRKAGGKAKE